MSKLAEHVKGSLCDDRGLETVEYAIITGLIVAGTIAAIAAIGVWVNTQFGLLQATLDGGT